MQSESEIQKQLAESESARAEAESANRVKAQFLTTMSHELRTPLNAIAGYTELLLMAGGGPVTSQQSEFLDRIQQSQRHLLVIRRDDDVVSIDVRDTRHRHPR